MLQREELRDSEKPLKAAPPEEPTLELLLEGGKQVLHNNKKQSLVRILKNGDGLLLIGIICQNRLQFKVC